MSNFHVTVFRVRYVQRANRFGAGDAEVKKKIPIYARKTNFVKRVESLKCKKKKQKKNQVEKRCCENALSIGDNNAAHMAHASSIECWVKQRFKFRKFIFARCWIFRSLTGAPIYCVWTWNTSKALDGFRTFLKCFTFNRLHLVDRWTKK